MTREDIHRKFIKDIGIVQRGEYQGYYCDEVHNMIDYMFDDFESRTCESCSVYYESDECIIKMVNFLDATTFACNRWRSKK